jgi:type IV secretion system protein VirB10
MSTQVIQPLEGEEGAIPSVAVIKPKSNTGRIIAIAGGMVVVLGGIGFAVMHALHHADPQVTDAKASALPDATAQPSPLKMPTAASAAEFGTVVTPSTQGTAGQTGTAVPSIAAQEGDAKAIPLRGSIGAYGAQPAGGGQPGAPAAKPIDPDDAPIFAGGSSGSSDGASRAGAGSGNTSNGMYAAGIQQAGTPAAGGNDPAATATNNLNALKGQLGGLMESLQKRIAAQGGGATIPTSAIAMKSNQPHAKEALFGSMESSATPSVSAHLLGNLSLTVPKGTLFLCSLKTRVITATSGFVACQTERNVLSADGKVSLLDRGAHLDGEYRVVTVKPGVTAVPVIWTRIRTSAGVVVDLDSPATDQLGASGLDGYVDNRWGERIGASVLLSLIQDAVQFATTPTGSAGSTNVVLPNTTGQGSKLAEKVLDATINIPPLLYQNQGGVVGIYVARDLSFSSVYELRPK